MCARARACVLQSFPIYVSFIFHSFIPCFFSSILPRLFSVCSTSVFHLSSICSSIYSSFVFNSFSVCFPPSLCLFFICRHLFYAHSSFPPHSFLHSLFFSIYLPFIFHLFSISVPFYFSVLGESRHSFTKPNMVRARSRLNTVLSRDQFSARISAKPTNGCQGETQSFPGKTLHVRLGSEIRELQLSK